MRNGQPSAIATDIVAFMDALAIEKATLAGYDHSKSSAYGTLYLNSASGAYTFVPSDGAIEGLKSTAKASFRFLTFDLLMIDSGE